MSAPAVLDIDDFASWRDEGLALIERLARSGAEFDAFTLQEDHKLRQPPHSNHWGILFNIASRRGLIEYVRHHRSPRPSRSGGACAVWRGLPDNSYQKATP